jgi:acetolactate synthase-1/2/3 large subunit
MSFPQRHPLTGPGDDIAYDIMLGLEAPGTDYSLTGPGIKTIEGRDVTDIGFGGIRERTKPSSPGGMTMPGPGGPPPGEGANDIVAHAETNLPLILEETRTLITEQHQSAIRERSALHAKANHVAHISNLKQALEKKRKGWEGSPVSTARIYAELWPLIKDEDWCLSSPSTFSSFHHVDLWDHDKPYSYLGGAGAAGIGYGIGASTGAALAARDRGRIVINIQCDGDLNYAPGSLWTAAHHRLPLLTIMHNNRAWHQELMFLQYMAGVRGRGTDRMHIGSAINDPNIDYAKMAESYGIESEGPISDPTELAAAFRRGIDTVKQGQPYLIDVLTQPR